MTELSAEKLAARILALRSDEELRKYTRFFRFDPEKQSNDNYFIGVKMGEIFKLGKEYSQMPVAEIERLMESPIHEVRVGAMSVMGQCAKGKKCTPERLKELYELYIRRHDRINNWDLVDLAAYYVVGQYVADKPRDVLYELAASKNMWERRTSIVATAHFILKLKQTDDTFRIAEMLLDDPEDLVHKGTGWMLRAAGDVDRPKLLEFLDRYSDRMPRVLLRYSIEKLSPDEKKRYLSK